MSTEVYVVGVDVGTGSARAALVSRAGAVRHVSSHPIATWSPKQGHFEQSSQDIWRACVAAIKEVCEHVNASQIRGVGFDATCSLVVLDQNFEPVSISTTGEAERDVVLWMDHRAAAEAERINSSKHAVLGSVGGAISLEMQTPKLLWLKNHLPEQCWEKAKHFFDLPDFLTWRATGDTARSVCSLVCKWTYQAHPETPGGWAQDFFHQVGLGDLQEDNWSKIGSEVRVPGSAVGAGLSQEAARATGLLPGTPVATSLIDAHAGTLALLGCAAPGVQQDTTRRLGLICGTSSCHMALSRGPLSVPGVWGPYLGAVLPGLWLSEGGQSATGRLLDHVTENHSAAPAVRKLLAPGQHLYELLNGRLESLRAARGLDSIARLTERLHVLPDFHGNRSPLADPTMTGMVCGLTLEVDQDSLALLYLATIQAIAYGTRHIVSTLQAHGHSLEVAAVCGGLSRNPVFVSSHADVLGLPVLVPEEQEAVLVGAAMLGACAANLHPSLEEAVTAMGGAAHPVLPNQADAQYHEKKYKIFLKMIDDQKSYERIMKTMQ